MTEENLIPDYRSQGKESLDRNSEIVEKYAEPALCTNRAKWTDVSVVSHYND